MYKKIVVYNFKFKFFVIGNISVTYTVVDNIFLKKQIIVVDIKPRPLVMSSYVNRISCI